eukprot:m.114546 g.114546  ORF g.114546 m.114546 type:complete len:145 (+) comp17117_c0_seq22:4474-4908(+)
MLSPRSSFGSHYVACASVTIAASGLGYLISALFPAKSAQIVAVVVSLTSAMFSGAHPTIPSMSTVPGAFLVFDASYSRWFTEAITEVEIRATPVLYHFEVQGALTHLGYTFENPLTRCCGMLVLIGVCTRVAALLALLYTYRRK